MSDRGFTILELLVACALLLAVTGVVAAIAVPLRDGFERSLGAADLTGGSRVVLDRLAADVREAGSGASVGRGRLSDVVAPIVPSASLDSSAWADPGAGGPRDAGPAAGAPGAPSRRRGCRGYRGHPRHERTVYGRRPRLRVARLA